MGKVQTKGRSPQDPEMILTPTGWRPKDKVQFVPPGHHVSGKGGKLKIIESASGKVIHDFGNLAKGNFEHFDKAKSKDDKNDPGSGKGAGPGKGGGPVPGPNNGPVPGPGGGVVPAPTNGWIIYSSWTNTGAQPIDFFSTDWIVPPAPATDNGQTIFLFNGIQQTSGGPYILQPVLQWGPSAAGGGSYWSITNWYVGSDGTAMYASLIQVNPGDNLRGIMTLTNQSGTDFSYLSSFNGFPTADLQVNDIAELTWANETLECYDLTAFSDYPDTALTAFTNIEIRVGGAQATINWTANDQVTDNGQHCVIVSDASPGGAVYLYYRAVGQSFYFVTDKSTFGRDEVSDTIADSGGLFPDAFWLILEGFTINELSIGQPTPLTPALSGAFQNLPGISLNRGSTEYELPGDTLTPQRIIFPYDIHFTAATLNSFPAAGSNPVPEILNGAITVGGNNLSAATLFQLVSGADPYFTDVDPSQNNQYWLSQDLRLFTAVPGLDSTPVSGGPTFSNDSVQGAFDYIQQLLTHLNNNFSNPAGADPFNSVLPGQSNALTGDSSVTPLSIGGFFQIFNNYNFAIAKVRLRGTVGPAGAANDVKVFFRLWSTETADTDFHPNSTYRSNVDAQNHPTSPLMGTANHTIPFFASGNLSGNTDYLPGGANNRTIQINSGDSVWAYFGCFLNLYDSGNVINGQQIQQLLNGTHHCMVAEIAYNDAPIINSNGITMSPENSDKLAQRNLQITFSDNPGGPATHRIPQTFDTRPSPALIEEPGTFLDYPDELMIEWGNTPQGSTANIYWPQVNAAQVLQLASKLYSTHLLSAADANTIQCQVSKGVTYIPIPPGGGQNFAGLFTIDLPVGVVAGEEFNIIVRRITTRRPEKENVIAGPTKVAAFKQNKIPNWRYVTGTFQVKIPVATKETILWPEENTLAIMKWRLQAMSPTNRWYPVLKRYISYISGRIDGLGGNADAIQPSLTGTTPAKDNRQEFTGKICEVVYNCFGDFEGFTLSTCKQKQSFRSCEKSIEQIVLRACKDRLLVAVFTEGEKQKIVRIVIKCCC